MRQTRRWGEMLASGIQWARVHQLTRRICIATRFQALQTDSSCAPRDAGILPVSPSAGCELNARTIPFSRLACTAQERQSFAPRSNTRRVLGQQLTHTSSRGGPCPIPTTRRPTHPPEQHLRTRVTTAEAWERLPTPQAQQVASGQSVQQG